ncbi:MAG TPA: hypothetical protein V6C97_36960 [Oculatellaceae cyanobacterium]
MSSCRELLGINLKSDPAKKGEFMSGLAQGAKFIRLLLFAVVFTMCSLAPGFAEPQEPVRTTSASLPKGDAKLSASAPIMNTEQRIKFYLTWGGAFVFVFVLVLVLVLWIFLNTRKEIEEEEEDDEDAPSTASSIEQQKPDAAPATPETSTPSESEAAKAEEPIKSEEPSKVEEVKAEGEAPASKEA